MLRTGLVVPPSNNLKWLGPGVDLLEIVAMETANAATVHWNDELGSLDVERVADISRLSVEEGDVGQGPRHTVKRLRLLHL